MWKRYASLFLVTILIAGGVVAQKSEEAPSPVQHVGIISGQALRSAASSNIGDDGISRLRDMLEELGATVQQVPPDQSIPDMIDLIIIIRPQRVLSPKQTAILWEFLQGGGHLMLALDPYNHAGARNERTRNRGINALIDVEYGLNIVDDFLIEPWFSINVLSNILTSWSDVKPDELQPHPITEPLVLYELPIRVWGARQITVSNPTGTSETNGLLYTETAHGEITGLDYRLNDPTQLELNIGRDTQGRLLLGGIATHYETGSRVALLGDSEIFQNIFGQTQVISGEETPLFPGDYLFAQRLLAWLMGIPQDEWPALPEGMTWISLDGSTSDWDQMTTSVPITETDSAIESVRVFHNNQFMYLAIQAQSGWENVETVELSGEAYNRVFTITVADGAISSDEETVPAQDADYAIDDLIEMRIPLRLLGQGPILRQICLQITDVDESVCLSKRMVSVAVDTIDPLPVRFTDTPTAFLRNNANLRSAPSETSSILALLPAREQFSIQGRDESGEWLYLVNGRYQGWVASFLVLANTSDSLPVFDP